MKKFKRIVLLTLSIMTLLLNGCKKDKFDEPPFNTTDPNLANTTIADLRALFSAGNPITITNDLIIGGVVTADDKSGNFYKQIVIQDETGAIPVLINQSGLNADFPVGRKIYIKCNGLVLGQYGNNLQLGGYIEYTGSQPSVGNIPGSLITKYIIKGPSGNPVTPLVISRFSDLNFTSDQSLLIELDPVEFFPEHANQPYADIVNESSLSRSIKDCYGDVIDVRTSNYSTFASQLTPSAGTKLKIVGIYSVYNNTRQLSIREISEVKTSTTPCGVDPALPTISIADLRALYPTPGLPLIINQDAKISGIVTANDRSGNFYKQIVIQDATGAIPILINKKELYKQFEIGRRIYVSINGLVIGQYGKNLQLGGYVDSSSATPAVGDIAEALIPNRILNGVLETPIVPRKISSFTELNLTSDQSVLVELEPVEFQAAAVGRPYADIVNGVSVSRKIQDCDANTLDVRTSNFATFANENTPSGKQKIIGIYSIFNTSKQLAIREVNEVNATTTACPTYLFENFEAATTSNIPGWLNISTAGVKTWTIGGTTNKNAEFNAFSSGEASNIGWLITPQLDFNVYAHDTLSFRMEVAFNATGTLLEVLHSSDYTGSGSPTSATWNVLATMPNVNQSWSSVTPISLDPLTGTGYIAFRYTGSGTGGQTTRYRVDDIRIKGND